LSFIGAKIFVMYRHRSDSTPRWLVVFIGILLLIGGYYVLRGLANFVESGGTGVLPTATDSLEMMRTAGRDASVPTLDFVNGTSLAVKGARICQEFKVKVVKARIRECPSESCETMDFPPQGTIICVYGFSKDAADWYEINVDPKDPILQLGYMHKSVLAPAHPTATPAPTLKLPTVTPIPTNTAKPTIKSTVTP
jgi:hypothetical protein